MAPDTIIQKRSPVQPNQPTVNYTLAIAHLRFNIAFTHFLPSITGNRIYQPYLGNHHPDGAHDFHINILIQEGHHQRFDHTESLFITENAWSIDKAGDQFIITSSEFSPYRWQAVCDSSFSNIQINVKPGSIAERLRVVTDLLPVLHYPLDQILFLHALASRQGLLLHSAGVQINHKGCLFCGVSGAGKSTISGLLLDKENIHIINDDRMVAHTDKAQQWIISGTPWPGDLQIAENTSLPLSALCFLKQDDKLQLTPLDRFEALQRLFQVASIPWYLEDLMKMSTDLCERLVSEIPVYELSFRQNDPVHELLQAQLA